MAKAAQKTDLGLTITRIFDAPRDLVFKMWSKPHHMQHWSCPEGFTNTEGEIDFREGSQQTLERLAQYLKGSTS